MNPEPSKDDTPKKSLREKLRARFNTVSEQEWVAIVKDTAKDLRSKKEIAVLAGASIIPFGWIGYGAYRVKKYRKNHPANDDTKEQPPAQKKKPPQPGA